MALRALCIGINDYPGTGLDLHGCVNDATDWARELRLRGFTAATLLNRSATGAAIRAGIADIVGAAARGDTVVVQFSGHGSFVPDKSGDEPDRADECICPSDIRDGYVTDDELFRLFAAARPGVQNVMIADSCHSGTIARVNAAHAASGRRVRFLPPAVFLDRDRLARLQGPRVRTKRRTYAALTLSGCQDAEFSYDDFFGGRPNGAFTHAALHALRGLPPGASYLDWHTALRRRLPSAHHPQTPCLNGSDAMKNAAIGWLSRESPVASR